MGRIFGISVMFCLVCLDLFAGQQTYEVGDNPVLNQIQGKGIVEILPDKIYLRGGSQVGDVTHLDFDVSTDLIGGWDMAELSDDDLEYVCGPILYWLINCPEMDLKQAIGEVFDMDGVLQFNVCPVTIHDFSDGMLSVTKNWEGDGYGAIKIFPDFHVERAEYYAEPMNEIAGIEDFDSYESGVDDSYHTTGELMVVTEASENPEVGEDQIFVAVEQPAEFPGGLEAMTKWLNDMIQYPESAKENEIQGRVYVKVVIEKDGMISSATVIKGVDQTLEGEALRVVEKMPKWNPAKINNHPVRSYFNIPVTFRIQN